MLGRRVIRFSTTTKTGKEEKMDGNREGEGGACESPNTKLSVVLERGRNRAEDTWTDGEKEMDREM